MSHNEHTYHFILELDGVEHQCSRVVVSKNNYLTQTVHAGMDQENDGLLYDAMSEIGMESVAKIIARKLIQRQG